MLHDLLKKEPLDSYDNHQPASPDSHHLLDHHHALLLTIDQAQSAALASHISTSKFRRCSDQNEKMTKNNMDSSYQLVERKKHIDTNLTGKNAMGSPYILIHLCPGDLGVLIFIYFGSTPGAPGCCLVTIRNDDPYIFR